jgi:hypothetical protein
MVGKYMPAWNAKPNNVQLHFDLLAAIAAVLTGITIRHRTMDCRRD